MKRRRTTLHGGEVSKTESGAVTAQRPCVDVRRELTDIVSRTRVIQLDAKGVEGIIGHDGIHDRLGKGTTTQDVELGPSSHDFADFAGMVVVGRSREKCGERGDIRAEIREIGEDCKFGRDVVGPANEEKGNSSYAWTRKVFDKRHARIDEIGHLELAPHKLVEVGK